MSQSGKSILKVYTSSTDKLGGKLLYEHIVYLAKDKGLSGVTVYRGVMGFGMSSSRVSSSRYWELTEKLPMMIEIIDEEKKLIDFYTFLEPELLKMSKGILITIEPIEVLLQKTGR
jgi:hypothetical protein